MRIEGEDDEKEILDGPRDATKADAGDEPEQDADENESEDPAESDRAEAEEVELAAEEKPRSRAAQRIERLSSETREAREEAAKLRQELAEFKAERRQSAAQETPEQVQQRMALMTPEERLEYKLDLAERRNQQQMQAMSFQMQDTSDKSAFAALCASDPTAKRYQEKVEAELTSIRAKGQNVAREALLDYIIGRDIRTRSSAAKDKQQKDGEKRISRQRVAPTSSRGDSQPAKRGEKSLEERLENVTF